MRELRRDPQARPGLTRWPGPARDWGIRPARWQGVELVVVWRRFMTESQAYYGYLLAAD